MSLGLLFHYLLLNMLAVNSEIIKQVHQVGLSLFTYQDDARSNKHKISYIFLAPLKHSFICVLDLIQKIDFYQSKTS